MPATSANLGPGFDCLGLALNVYLEVSAEAGADGLRITSNEPDNGLGDGDKAGVFCTPRDAAGTLAAVVACEQALENGGTVPVDPV